MPTAERSNPAEQWTTLTTRVLAPNPGEMTLDGTNSYLLRAPGSEVVVVVDPGPADTRDHQLLLAHAGRVELVLVTHHHQDHAGSISSFAAVSGAPVRALDPRLCVGAPALRDGEVIHSAGCRIRVLATPGHTSDSICLHLPDDSPLPVRGAAGVDGSEAAAHGTGSMLTGDTILGSGSTVIAPDGSLKSYLNSLARLRGAGPATVLPGHGPARPDLEAACDEYIAHRRQRLDQVVAALAATGLQPSVAQETVSRVADLVYPDLSPTLRAAAEAATRAQLEYLEAQR